MLDHLPDQQDHRIRQETASLRAEITAKVRAYTERQERVVSPFRGLTITELHGPLPPLSYMYQSSVSLIVQGEKRVTLGDKTYFYNESRFLLTAVNLPTVAEVMQASAERPFISLLLELDLSLAREVLVDMEQRGSAVEFKGEGISLSHADRFLFDAMLRYLTVEEGGRLENGNYPTLRLFFIQKNFGNYL